MDQKVFSLNNGTYDIPCRLYCCPQKNSETGIIIAVHGFGGDKESSVIRCLAEEVTKHNYEVVCFDFPAHGDSPVDYNFLSVENCCRDFKHLVTWCNQNYSTTSKKKGIFATSFGGYITLNCADVLSDFNIVLRAPAVAMQNIILHTIANCNSEKELEEKSPLLLPYYDRPISVTFDFYKQLIKNDVSVKSFNRPMLIIRGDKDTVVLENHISEFMKVNPEAKLVIIPGADHRFKETLHKTLAINSARDYYLLQD